MCKICSDWEKGKLTAKDAMRNIGEVISSASKKDAKHLMDLSDRILDKDIPLKETDPVQDENWWKENHEE